VTAPIGEVEIHREHACDIIASIRAATRCANISRGEVMFRKLSFAAAMLIVAACSQSTKTANEVKPCVKSSGRTAGEAAKTGGNTAVAGMQTFGESVGGFFEGGSEEAKRKWEAGAQNTKATATEGGSSTKAEAGQTGADCD
jgi:hypothetical protein